MDVMALLGAASTLSASGRPEEAATLYRSWIAEHPDDPMLFVVLFNFGTLWNALGAHDQAAEAFRLAIEHNPDFIPPYINRGNSLEQAGDRRGAVAQWNAAAARLAFVTREAIDYKLIALKQMARVMADGDLDQDAENLLQQSLTIDPGQGDVMQHWLNLRQRQCRWPLLASLPEEEHRRALTMISPLSLASLSDDPLWQLANAACFTEAEIGRPSAPFADRPLPEASGKNRRLRIGYLSSDLWQHAVGFLTAEIYGLHDRAKVEIFAYHSAPPKEEDRLQQRIRASVDQWRELHGVENRAAAQIIEADGIDILVDLNGHTKDARTPLLAYNPAPIIVNWLGFPGSMGSAFHHYLIADPFIIPPEAELYYSEKVVRLPCYQPVDRQRLVSDAPQRRADAGLPEEAMVFCCFNEPRKITEATWQRWMRILASVPDSVLWLLVPADATQAHLRELAGQAGVAPSRLVFAQRQKNPEHLARYRLADLILDSFPYGAHTTASDALWMGVPVLTLAGRCFASRVCGSLLQAAGLPELICDSEEDYFRLAVEIGSSRQKRTELARRLEQNRAQCLLFDTPRLVRELESLYQSMWQDYVAGRRPQPDLSNMAAYRDIGVELALEPAPPADYHEAYRRRLASRRPYLFLSPDKRLWPAKT